VIRALEHLGWQVVRQRGSHIILSKPGSIASLSVLQHEQVARGTLRTLIAKAGISVQAFRDALGE